MPIATKGRDSQVVKILPQFNDFVNDQLQKLAPTAPSPDMDERTTHHGTNIQHPLNQTPPHIIQDPQVQLPPLVSTATIPRARPSLGNNAVAVSTSSPMPSLKHMTIISTTNYVPAITQTVNTIRNTTMSTTYNPDPLMQPAKMAAARDMVHNVRMKTTPYLQPHIDSSNMGAA